MANWIQIQHNNMKIVIYCRYCKKEIKQRKSESAKLYSKRKYHQECKHPGMKKERKGFYDPMSYPTIHAKVRYTRGYVEPESMKPDYHDI